MRSQKSNPRFFEEMAKMATGAFGSFGDVRHHIKALVRERIEQVMAELDMVSRAEFDHVEAMAQKARIRQEELEKRLVALEGKTSPSREKAKPAKKTETKKPAKRKTKK